MNLKNLSFIILICGFSSFNAQYTGNVGINTTTPTATLSVKGKGNTIATQALKVENSDGDNLLTINDNGTVSGLAVSNMGGGNGLNGTAGGQVFVTSSTAPFSPQAVTMSGDISILPSGLTAISNNVITSAKIGDLSVTTSKLDNASVTPEKISATGTANSTTFLRGDGTWATPPNSGSGGSGLTMLTTVFTANFPLSPPFQTTVTLNGANVGDTVIINPQTVIPDGNYLPVFFGAVTAANTVRVYVYDFGSFAGSSFSLKISVIH